jgi:hypothetical protein
VLFLATLLGQHNFDIKTFINPPLEYGPYTRWWWPGNDVDKEEVRREIKMFADNGFAGVEIQPFTTGINPESPRLNYIYSWDSPAYYSNLIETLHEARKVGLIVDLNAGSGWPMSSPNLLPSESILSLMVVDTVINSEGNVQFEIPFLRIDNASLYRSGRKTHYDVNPDFYQLENVIAAKIINKADKIVLDFTQFFDIPFNLKNKIINWELPSKGEWCFVFVYIGPGGEKPLYTASKDTFWVTDPLDITSLDKSLNYLFGPRTNLAQFYGNPLRAIFLDSKEFIVDRHISNDFVSYFKKKRGYDISPYLILNSIKNYDNAYSFGRDTVPKYVLSTNDWRIRYDYNKTISELFIERQYNFVSNWLESRKMFCRSQSYGHRGDIISASGMTSIPEAEQLSGNSSDGLVKLVTSGAHLNNKPVIAQESFVFASKGYMTTPQKIRVYANKSFAQGINQIIYHGTAYKYKTNEYGEEGWYPWSSPYKSFNYSSNINESNHFWKYINDINQYIARSQYALRSGKPKTDVLIYFPFIDFEASQIVLNPHDKVVTGTYDKDEPFFFDPSKISVKDPTKLQKYYIELWPIINKLEMLGITWDFVNDEFLLNATSAVDNQINIRGNLYHTLIIPKIPYMTLSMAQKIQEFCDFADLLVVENFPNIQPGFFNCEQNDAELRKVFASIIRKNKVNFVNMPADMDKWFQNINQDISFNGQYDFIKQQQRLNPDGSIIKFLWNQSDKKQDIELIINKKFKYSYWLSAEKNISIKNKTHKVQYALEPYEAIILYVTNNNLDESSLIIKSQKCKKYSQRSSIICADKWDIKAGETEIMNTGLFDLRTDSSTQFISDEIIYTTSVDINKNKYKHKKIILDLGKVYYTATVYVNGKKSGDIIWPPYKIDISNLVVPGNNNIKIIVTPTDRNKFVGEGIKQNKYYVPVFKNKLNTLMPAGLVGTVKIIME